MNEEMCEISFAELKDLQRTVNINKDIIKSLMETQQATSPSYKSLQDSILKLNEENQILHVRINRQKPA